MFADFERFVMDGAGAKINGVIGGSGPPVLLLHGYPQTHLIWRNVAPALAQSHTVVATDLRGYGDSEKPASDARHETYSKRAMAADQVAVMAALGFAHFAVVGHDRGGRVAHRLARDHRDAVEKVAVLDIAPTAQMYGQTDMAFATGYYHWFFLIQPSPLPETLLAAETEFYLRRKMMSWGRTHGAISEEAFAEYLRCFETENCIHATCEDYRASATIDLEHDAQETEKLDCPLLALWGEEGFVARTYDVLSEWRQVANDVRGHAVRGGHYVPEEAPEQTIKALRDFL